MYIVACLMYFNVQHSETIRQIESVTYLIMWLFCLFCYCPGGICPLIMHVTRRPPTATSRRHLLCPRSQRWYENTILLASICDVRAAIWGRIFRSLWVYGNSIVGISRHIWHCRIHYSVYYKIHFSADVRFVESTVVLQYWICFRTSNRLTDMWILSRALHLRSTIFPCSMTIFKWRTARLR